jgi:hypothetical protein
MKQTILLVIISILLFIPCSAQDKKESITPVDCEVALRYLENAITKAKTNTDRSLIFILHSGSGESNKLASLRMKQLKAYVSNWGINTVVAQGESVKGYGIWEIYLEGKLLYSLPLFKNQGLKLVGGCID